jgi:hypothetical protein
MPTVTVKPNRETMRSVTTPLRNFETERCQREAAEIINFRDDEARFHRIFAANRWRQSLDRVPLRDCSHLQPVVASLYSSQEAWILLLCLMGK